MPEPFVSLTSKAVVLSQANIDTDQIIPARFLTTTTREGLGRHAFHDWRYEADGAAKPEAVLNRIDPSERRILITGPNFACGSSREHAPWALMDYGFQAVISTSIADIFTSNALKNGLLPIEVSQADWDALAAEPDRPIRIDLEACEIRAGNAAPIAFSVEPFARRCLLDGVDPLGWLLARLPDIHAYEASRQPETA
ncbi:3-isopropylmalate dehydratase small subunit [Brevundimonas sp. Root1279]|uniref:3-isopropylmalate dehydratase small subunit n=1 Tax=Brevundimonas sp. Root1279 TaxID=1736443 RepID=UPI0006FCE8E8|nr:3-isopropylmalate dehydratase small subunit [Brevundimonas sp. Root1279]KQW80844.1 isopropylmalate isomerase [Brevundimonas sp. Root1279]